MRILELSIDGPFKNLNRFSIVFDSSREVTIILGRNGSAKSNLLEVLITIFRDIDLNKKSPFGYQICYELNEKKIRLVAAAGHKPSATVDDQKVKMLEVRQCLMPTHVVGYYSGLSDRFEKLFWPHDNKALDETLRASDDTARLEFRRFINARPEHGLFALLAFYFSQDKGVSDFLSDLPRIVGFDSVLITIRKPEWARSGSTASNFWGAKGPVRVLLDRLQKHSLAPFSRVSRVQTDFRQNLNREIVYLYLPDMEALGELAAEYDGDPRQLFQALDTMRLSGLLEDFRVRVKVKGADSGIHTRELSEGEQQLLTVLGLMRFTRHDSSLYLLDEPDTHLNPTWGLQYLKQLRNVAEIDENSHTFIATHDPLLVAGLEKEEIRVMLRDFDGQVRAVEPEESPRGRGVAAALTSELFGLESQLDLESQRVLKEIYKISDQDTLSDEDKTKLCELRDKLPGLIPEEVERDPYRALARRAYEEAQDALVNSGESADWKRAALDKLRAKLIKEAGDQ